MAHKVMELSDLEARLYDVKDIDASWALRAETTSVITDSPIEDTRDQYKSPRSETLTDVEVLSMIRSSEEGKARPGPRPHSSASAAQSSRSVSTTRSMESPTVATLVDPDYRASTDTGSSTWQNNARSSGFSGSSDTRPTIATSVTGRYSLGHSEHGNGNGNDLSGTKTWTQATQMIMMELEPMALAMELTKMQWKYFEAIRVGHLPCHPLDIHETIKLKLSLEIYSAMT